MNLHEGGRDKARAISAMFMITVLIPLPLPSTYCTYTCKYIIITFVFILYIFYLCLKLRHLVTIKRILDVTSNIYSSHDG